MLEKSRFSGTQSFDGSMKIGLITLFPEMFTALSEQGVCARAIKAGKVDLHFFNPRDYTVDRHQTVDARPYGGGPGMVMMVEPLAKAVADAKGRLGEDAVVVYLSPQGQTWRQSDAEHWASNDKPLILIAGRYEGVDERFIERYVDLEWSVGDVVLSGGELPAMVVLDSIIRLLPDVLGDEQSAQQDSFVDGLLDCPHYTRPEQFGGMSVPEVLLSGNHQRIERWRMAQMLVRTQKRRPDLFEKLTLTEEQQRLMAAVQRGEKI
jgi:tRNA (guanine37-N1)-methyltransferase